jgi:hypothetical protein
MKTTIKKEPVCEPAWGFEKVEVYKTNVCCMEKAADLIYRLQVRFPGIKFNFDLTDCDKILRAQGLNINNSEIIRFMNHQQFFCEVLPD